MLQLAPATHQRFLASKLRFDFIFQIFHDGHPVVLLHLLFILFAPEDGDGLQQNVLTNLGKGSRKGLTDGLRDFIRVDNDRALDVGAPRRGTGTFKVRKSKVPEG